VPRIPPSKSIGNGKMIVLFFSALIVFRVCRYLKVRAAGDSEIISLASFKALAAGNFIIIDY
jgi:hypothetical protein